MVAQAVLPPEVAEFRQEAFVVEADGTLYIMLHGGNDNEKVSPFKRPFQPIVADGVCPSLDDGDPHWL